MKRLLTMFVLLCTIQVSAQVNITASCGLQFFQTETVATTGQDIFLLTSEIKDSAFYNAPLQNIRALQYRLYKISAVTNSIVKSVIACGDTVQADSFIYDDYVQIKIAGNKIHLFYTKGIVKGTQSQQDVWDVLYYQQLDLDLNVTIPEKRLLLSDNTQRFSGITLIDVAAATDKLVIGYIQYDVNQSYAVMSAYLRTDLSGNIIDSGILGHFDPATSAGYDHIALQINEYPGDRFFVTGYGILKPHEMALYLADNDMHIIDSSGPGGGDLPSGKSYYWNRYPDIIALPTGSLVKSGVLRVEITADSNTYYSGIVKDKANAKFDGTAKVLLIGEKDAADKSHFTGWGPWDSDRHLAYSSTDNLIYFSNSVYTNYMGGGCEYGYNYTQVVCTDTNLQVKWRRYIYSGDTSCMHVKKVVSREGGSGVLISGIIWNTPADLSEAVHKYDFLYNVDSTGYVNVPVVSGPHLRDRINIYPNPATGIVNIDDLFKKGGTAHVYDVSGRIVTVKQYSANDHRIDMQPYPAGLYLIRIATEDGEDISMKLLKQ